MTWLTYIPFEWLRAVIRSFRKTFFTKPRPKGEYLVIDPTGNTLEYNVRSLVALLGSRSYSPNWELSYNRKGESLNLARVVYAKDEDQPDIVWWQIHVRGWVQPDGTIELTAHWEPEPTEYSKPHLNGVGFDREKGMDYLKATLTQSDFDFEVVYKL
ncbi:MAG: hypothetical protein ABEK59_01215 [Halobacteria archaeon]